MWSVITSCPSCHAGAEPWVSLGGGDAGVAGELRWKRPRREVSPPLGLNLGGKTT